MFIIKSLQNNYKQISLIKGCFAIIVSFIIFLLGIAAFFLPMVITVEIGNFKTFVLVTAFFGSAALMGFLGMQNGLNTIKSISPIKDFYCEPRTIASQVCEQKIPRFKFLRAAHLNPKAMQVSTIYSIWISLSFLTLYLLIDKTTTVSEKILFLLLLILANFLFKVPALIMYNRLYIQMQKVVTVVNKQGIYWLFFDEETFENSEEVFDDDEDSIIVFTPWKEIQAINYYKDYVVLHCEARDYIFFVNDESEKAVINTYFTIQNNENL